MISKNQIFDRVAKLFSFRYDCRLRFIDPGLAETARDTEILNVANRNERSQLIINKKDVVMPLTFEGEMLAVAVFEGGGKLIPSKMEHLRNALDLVIAGILSQGMLKADDEDGRSNLLSFEDAASRDGAVSHPEIHDSFEASRQENLLNPKVAVLIEASKDMPVRELALEIHEQSKQQFFLGASDLTWSEVQTVQNIKDLGAMTLFIADLSLLDMRIQKLLARYLSETEIEDRDLKIIASVSGQIDALTSLNLVDFELAELIQEMVLVWPADFRREATIAKTLAALVDRGLTSRKRKLSIVKDDLH